jgi:hypothetical protein
LNNATKAASEPLSSAGVDQLAGTQRERRAQFARTTGRDLAIEPSTGHIQPQPQDEETACRERPTAAVKWEGVEIRFRHRERRVTPARGAADERLQVQVTLVGLRHRRPSMACRRSVRPSRPGDEVHTQEGRWAADQTRTTAFLLGESWPRRTHIVWLLY